VTKLLISVMTERETDGDQILHGTLHSLRSEYEGIKEIMIVAFLANLPFLRSCRTRKTHGFISGTLRARMSLFGPVGVLLL
jgi:hypothetical protein